MKYLKMLGLAAVAAMALMAVVGASAASATTLEIKGVAQNAAVTINATLEPGTSALLKDSAGTTTDTCTESEVHGKTTEFTTPGSAEIHGNVEKLTFGKCTHTTTVLKAGKLFVGWIPGTTDGTVTSSEAEVTVVSTAFGISAVCKTGGGTDIGKLTGATNGGTNKTAFATMDIEGKISCGILGTSTWTGFYSVTSPEELAVRE
ncbi:MAG TPA: hypothetical protein VLK37_03430 [Solirubrobacterales bacterium]|nr:hypothetical protein [Solirubrobacterales bacterium]